MGRTKGSEGARGSQSEKPVLSSDWSLQLDAVKLVSLVSADQQAAVKACLGVVHAARHTAKAGYRRGRWHSLSGREAPKVWSVIGVMW